MFRLVRLPEITDRPINCIDERRKLTRHELVMGNVFADDLGREMGVVSVGVHVNIPRDSA
jgi:hypothetical protein